MPLRYHELDEQTRLHMLAELDHDEQTGKQYVSSRLTASGQQQYFALLRDAITNHNDAWLAGEISRQSLLSSHEERSKPKGGRTMAKVPYTAPQTLADGEFNRFYCRGVCARSIAEELTEVEVYRGQASAIPRPESEARIGKRLSARAVLLDLRTSIAVEPALGVPAGMNSGLTIRRVLSSAAQN
jgi:hypothetical protein